MNLWASYLQFRYALTLRIMLANLRRKVGIAGPIAPLPGGPSDPVVQMAAQQAPFEPPVGAPLTVEELGINWPSTNQPPPPLNVNDIPIWLRGEASLV